MHAANIGSECAGAGALSRPRVNACACGYQCRSWGRPWEPSQCRPEPGAAADGQRTPRTKDNLYRRRSVEQAAPRRRAHGCSKVNAERQEEPRRRKRRRNRCASTDRTRGGRCLR